MEPLSAAASIIAVMQLTERIVQICGRYLHSVKNAQEDIQHLQLKIVALAQVLRSLDELLHGPDRAKLLVTQDMANNLAICSALLTILTNRIAPEAAQGRMRKWGLRALKWPLARSEIEKFVGEIERYITTFSLSLQVDQTKTISLIDQKMDLGRLRTAEGAAFDAYANQHGECLQGTRMDLLQDIEKWIKAPCGKPIFWLEGMAGTGKSTISRTIASFFFNRGEEDRGTAKRLFSTLVDQLVIGIPQMLPKVLKAIDDDPRISEKDPREQFEKLLRDPLLGIEQSQHEHTTRVIVIDALDECDREDDIRLILRLLPKVHQPSSIRLQFFLTSRPELPIRLGFKEIPDAYQNLVLQKVPKPVIEHDITLYFKDRFSRIRQERSLPSDWPGDAVISILVERAVPLFIAAVILCLFIGDAKWNPRKRLEAILRDQSAYVSKMDSTYTPVLTQLLTGQNRRETAQILTEFREVVGVIIMLATPLSINALSQLLDRGPDDVKCRLDPLQSVLSVPDDFDAPIRLLHLSFRDFLLDPENSRNEFWIDEKNVNRYLTVRCLRTMQQRLRKNICRLPSEGTQWQEIEQKSVRHYIPAELCYACRYWAAHLLQSHDPVKELTDAFSFLEKYFLHWLEAMSILGFLSEVIVITRTLESIIETQADRHSKILEFLSDARRFVLTNRRMAEIGPLQLYSSGLIFAPKSSKIRNHFWDDALTRSQLPKVEENWGPELQSLEGHSGSVFSVAFSPDGQVLATGSDDQTVRLWDAKSGELHQTLKAHSGCVRAVAFSPDGQVLASASHDQTVRLWDSKTGELCQILEAHLGWVLSVAFFPDGQMLASGSNDQTVRLWDAKTGELYKTLEAHSGWVLSVALSPDGQVLASGSNDTTVRLWDAKTGELRQTLEAYPRWVLSVTFSPDGQTLVSGSDDQTVRLWDAKTGELRQILESPSGWLHAVAFSPEGQTLASGSNDTTVRLWDAKTGEVRQTLKGHSGLVRSVIFSPDGHVLATGSDDQTVRLWDIEIREMRQTLEGHSGRVTSIVFSPDGQTLASGSVDQTVRLWDAKTGELCQTLEAHSGMVLSVAFSPDGQALAFRCIDQTMWLWEAETGELRQSQEDNGLLVWFEANVEVSIVDDHWVCFRGKRVLWLPPDFRPSFLAFRNGTLALGQPTGRVSLISNLV